MLNNISKLGKSLNKSDQKQINGGGTIGHYGSCVEHLDEASCLADGCVWYNGQYCSASVPHIDLNP